MYVEAPPAGSRWPTAVQLICLIRKQPATAGAIACTKCKTASVQFRSRYGSKTRVQNRKKRSENPLVLYWKRTQARGREL